MLLYNTLSDFEFDSELFLASVLSVEYFAEIGPNQNWKKINENHLEMTRADYQIILDQNYELAEKLNFFYDFLLKSGFAIKNVGSIYALIRGEDLSQIYSITETIPHEPNLYPIN